MHLSPLVLRERELIVTYLRRQADGCTKKAIELESRGDDVMAASQRALARTIEALSERVEEGAHRLG
ncbi:hypothetical protein [Nannocystis sp. SCPEA4]|uniref:hypothetical protein n=1 Tax=Nannocystis sp. SCPEA4 TaxID=2996787 RepID=UPI00226EB93D|nr:hypothetical protein [Nannocystis sp. SCPEA4]MCY1055445.1 hypothetical protein [Nannocystis sp. SCPEA4]